MTRAVRRSSAPSGQAAKPSMLTHGQRVWILVLCSLAAACGLYLAGPIPQDPGYHLFADARQLGGVSNFWNVASNLPFLATGLIGLRRYPRLAHRESGASYLILCLGALGVGFGSAYYHLAPSNATLLWDRLPMTLGFMALLALVLNERVARSHRTLVLCSLVAVGLGAALYWSWSESLGRGDLRPYALVQFLPFLLLPLILVLFRRRHLSTSLLLTAFGCYLVAKLLEYFDGPVFIALGVLSGHALKHVAAALAVLCILYAVPTRRPSR
jgi:Ceramidase